MRTMMTGQTTRPTSTSPHPSTPTSPDTLLLPGAWPSSAHRRAATYPSPRPDRLAQVLDFQQRLVNEMEINPTPINPENTVTATNSLDSELTRRTDTSSLIIADTSISTACTSDSSSSEQNSPTKLPRLAFKPTHTSLDNEYYTTRIPRHVDLSRRRSDQPRFKSKHAVFDSPSPPRLRPSFTTNLTPSSSHMSTSPMSPIIFSSPTSSTFPPIKPFHQSSLVHHSSSSEYASSPSWETSYGSYHEDSELVEESPSPSPSHANRSQSLVPRLSATTRTPSIEISPAPMLTDLSLPASPNTSIESDPISPRIMPVDDGDSPWTLSLTSSSPVLSAVPDPSLSPVSLMPSGSILAPSTIPDIDSEMDLIANSSATAYATAVVTSAWTPDAPSLTELLPVAMDVDSYRLSPAPLSAPIELNQRVPPSPAQTSGSKSVGIIEKLKKFGHKLKKIWRQRANQVTAGISLDTDAAEGHRQAGHDFADVIDIQSHTSAAQEYNSLLSNHDTSSLSPLLPLPPPPGLGIRRPKARPLLSTNTYSNTRGGNNNSPDRVGPHVLRRPQSSNQHSPKVPTPELIAAQARPKTLAEIKSRRRLSLPVLTDLIRTSNPPRPINVVTTNRRPRPVSALAFHPRPPPLSSLRSAHSSPSSPPIARDFAVTNTSTSPRESDGAKKKKTRRFSLSRWS